ncbi:hypothetical protein D5R40_16340 [Okeania hirsuta]|uniref:Uncharacterized protein n=1 Tax=Okeania hirsuta TaxID=1458930 RepID=A0A3N6PA28_9CYAN|nr:class I SAM-dependent methyltransferase [Okeania hirsuta]RQH40797.1 hypothetical protein D5R40_16340 [Okeania hirsuta]
MSDIEKQKQSQKSLEQLAERMKLLSEYKSKLSLAKTSLDKYQNTSENPKSTASQSKSIKYRDNSITTPVNKLNTDAQTSILPTEKYKNKLAKLSGCHIDEYSYIINTISPKTPNNFLIFGVGRDSGLWMEVNKEGRTIFIEDNPEWFNWAKETYPGIVAYLVDYGTKRKDWLNLLTEYSQGKECLSMVLPEEIVQTKWDVIFVDAPAGYSEKMPGRMKSIYIAAKLAFETGSTDVFVHDCHRQVENIYSSYFFHQENLVTEIRRLRHYKITGGEGLLHQKSIKLINQEQHQSENIQVEISSIKLLKPVSNLLHGYCLDKPKKGQKIKQNWIKLGGWVVGKNSPAIAVEIISNGQVIKTVSINQKRFRPDVAKVYPQVSYAKTSGFATDIDVISLPKISELTLQAILKDKSIVPLCSIKLHIQSHKSIGVIYIATGERFIREACESVASLKAQMPNMPVTIFASKDIKNSNFDQVVVIEKPDYNHVDKIKYMYASPYDYTLFIDTDTYISANFSEIFTLLDKFDLGVAHAPCNIRGFVNGIPESFQQLNTGVILYKKSPQIEEFFAKWLTLYKLPHGDQPTFREILYNSQLRIATLPPEYNCRFPFPGAVSGTVKILHGRHKNLPLVAEKINSSKRLRVIKPQEFKDNLDRSIVDKKLQLNSQDVELDREELSLIIERKSNTVKEAIANNNLEGLLNSKLWCKKGHLNPDQAIFISNLCKIVQPKYVLETGFATGRSAAVVLSSCSPKTFISLDKNLDYITPFGREMAAILMGKFKDYQIIEGDSNELLNPEFYQTNYSSGLDWFTVDGDHSYQGCLHDLESSLRFLNPQGIVIVDDYKSGPPKGVRCPSVNKAVRDFCSRYPEVHKLEWHNNGKGLAILSKSAKQLEIIANLLQLKQPQK